MARVRGSHRKAPPDRSPQPRSARRIHKSHDSESALRKYLDIGLPITEMDKATAITPKKRRSDSHQPGARDAKRVRFEKTPAIASHGHINSGNGEISTMTSSPGKPDTTQDETIPQVVEPACQQNVTSQPVQTSLHALLNNDTPIQPSWDAFAPAPYETNETRKARAFAKEQERMDELHDRRLVYSNQLENKIPQTFWENSKKRRVIVPASRKDGRAQQDVLRLSSDAAKHQAQLAPLKGHGKPMPPLSSSHSVVSSATRRFPAFPIAPPSPSESTELVLGTHPIDLKFSPEKELRMSEEKLRSELRGASDILEEW